jgi:hypothetical protein
MKVNVELLQHNRLVGTHVHARGDVIEMDQAKAREWIKAGFAAVTNRHPTPIPVSVPKHRNDFPVTRTASDPEAAAALKEAEERAKQANGRGKSKVA